MGQGVTTKDTDIGYEAIIRRIKKVGHLEVAVGVMGSKAIKGGAMTQVDLAIIHEYGATIQHPGGTSFGFKKKGDIKKGKVRFLKKGEGVISLGKTGSHTITIPPRPAHAIAFDENKKDLQKHKKRLFDDYVMGKTALKQALSSLGQIHSTNIKNAIQAGDKLEPNAPSTIRKKGSDKPLFDTGNMLRAITHKVRST